MIGQLASIVTPVFIAVGVGFGMARVGRQGEPAFIHFLILNIGTPCLIFATFAEIELTPGAVGTMALAAFGALVAGGTMALVLLKAAGMSVRAYLPALTHPNTGNMGLPLCLFAFGEQGLALGLSYYVVIAFSQFTVTPSIALGSLSLGRIARTPLIYAVAAALAFLLSGVEVPLWLANTTALLGDVTIPLLLITLGASLARLKVADLKNGLWLSAVRLGMGFAIGMLMAWALGLEGVERGVVILQSAMPVAVFNYLFAAEHGTDPEGVAGMVVISTLLSFLFLPLLLWYVL